MFQIHSVHFDDCIQNWHTPKKVISNNVLVMVIHGKVLYSINGKQIVGESGDLLYIPYATEREGKNYQSEPHKKYTVLFLNNEDETKKIPMIKRGHFIKLNTHYPDYVLQRFKQLYTEIKEGKVYRNFICNGILQELIGSLARELVAHKDPPTKIKYVMEIRQYLSEHYRDSIEINQIAKLIHRSPNYTISVFKEVTGVSPIKYVNYLRITEACNLLLNTDMTIANIANYLGYYDASYFSRTFKKMMSMSPKQFMNEGDITKVQLFS